MVAPQRDRRRFNACMVWSISDRFAGLLYKIDAVFLRCDGRHCLEMAVEVALVKKPALKSSLGDIPALSQEGPGLLYPAVHTVGVGRYACNRFEAAYQSIGIDAEILSKGIKW